MTLEGVSGHVVDVQADVAQGLITTTLVGRPDASVNEARDRCRTAMVNSGFDWPTTRRVTVLLSPADLPKRGSHFDLAIAVAVLAADEAVPKGSVDGIVMLGELTLDGRLRAVPGVLPMVLAARASGFSTVMLPDLHVEEAAMVPGMTVVGVRSLRQAIATLRGHEPPDEPPVAPPSGGSLLTWRGERRAEELDLRDVHGMADARFALEVAAAGGHHLLLSGPKGAGKTTLAERLPGLLPDLTAEEALELAAVRSLSGELDGPVQTRPPFRAPHHTASKASVLGGGTGRVHPGEISRALHGVLFLDEFPLFGVDLIDALRQPLENGEVTIARGDEVATFPARTTVVLAANPCPCGDYHPDVRESRCTCSEVRRRSYRDRVSGPVTDRIDVVRHLSPVRPHELRNPLHRPESTAEVRARVEVARERQAVRYAGTPWRVNGDVPGSELAVRWPLPAPGQGLVDQHLGEGRLTRRGAARVHRLAWTVADLRGLDEPGTAEVDTALRLRAGEPLPVSALATPTAAAPSVRTGGDAR
ncbi:YifB family Mg chelatase-like AAA ATPase [Nocardioides caldifontis]|uniref:YifB family Mg chelatase-like AAA ATPase n=1 Tax=Nocardioides caldifontis TaxID=2588938 RepID=UPI001EEFE4E8|nr:YifB family Mg chelatase-like AAA ATPase [Nocardioides caldifontis]